jgi:hypothetical protein
MNKRIGKRMREVRFFVKNNPGLAMIHSARIVAPHGSLHFGYRTVHRAIDAGIVFAKSGPRGSKLLFTCLEDARESFEFPEKF